MLFTGHRDSVGASPIAASRPGKRSLTLTPLTRSFELSSHRSHSPAARDMCHSFHRITYHIVRVIVVIVHNPYHVPSFRTSILTL